MLPTRDEIARRVVTRRDSDQMTWAQIGKSFDPQFSASKARRLYDEVKGEGAHYGLPATPLTRRHRAVLSATHHWRSATYH